MNGKTEATRPDTACQSRPTPKLPIEGFGSLALRVVGSWSLGIDLGARGRAFERAAREDRNHRATISLAGMDVGVDLLEILARNLRRRLDRFRRQRLTRERLLDIREPCRMRA